MSTTPIDTGTAYGRPAPSYKSELTEVRAGTPMGELLRRYWHPIGLAADANATPRLVRVLGEDLVLFRDQAGRPGPVGPAGARLSALHAPRCVAGVWQGRGAWDPLLLPRLVVRCAGPLPGAAV